MKPEIFKLQDYEDKMHPEVRGLGEGDIKIAAQITEGTLDTMYDEHYDQMRGAATLAVSSLIVALRREGIINDESDLTKIADEAERVANENRLFYERDENRSYGIQL